jgi:hypothetical protein
LGSDGQRAGDLEPPLIAVGQVHRELARTLDADELEELERLLLGRLLLAPVERRVQDHPGEAGPQPRVHANLDVLHRRHRAEQLDVLEGARDARPGHEVGALGGDVPPCEGHLPGGGPVQAGQAVEERRLPPRRSAR